MHCLFPDRLLAGNRHRAEVLKVADQSHPRRDPTVEADSQPLVASAPRPSEDQWREHKEPATDSPWVQGSGNPWDPDIPDPALDLESSVADLVSEKDLALALVLALAWGSSRSRIS